MIQSVKKFLSIAPEDLKLPVILKQKGDVFYLLLNTKANAFSNTFIRQIHAELDKVQAYEGPTSLVTISLSKMFSGGLDLKYMSHLDPADAGSAVLQLIRLLGRISVFPCPTFGLVRGGAVAGGAMFAFAHDYIHVGGKAMFSFNQAQNQLPLPPGMMSVIKKRHSFPNVLRDMVVFSKQFEAKEALESKFIDGIMTQQEAINVIHAKAEQVSFLGQNKQNMKNIKCQLHKQVVQACFHKQLAPMTVAFTKTKTFPKL